MARRHKGASHLAVNHERWLVSYADFITLLFAFFVVMYSVSQVSEDKYRVLSETLSATFRVQQQTLNPFQVGQPSLSSDPSVIDAPLSATGTENGDGAFEQQTDLPHLAEQVRETFGDLIEREWVTVTANEDWLEIALKSQLLFDSASAQPNRDARLIFSELAALLKSGSNPIQIEGHTDDQPILTDRYPSNWELSAARASAAVKLLAEAGVAPDRLAAVGYGEFQPLADNSTEAGRAQNRRVAVMVARHALNRPAVDQLPSAWQQGAAEARQTSAAPDDAPAVPASGLQPSAPSGGEAPVTPSGLRAIKLENGGLLFTSDPARIQQAEDAAQENDQ